VGLSPDRWLFPSANSAFLTLSSLLSPLINLFLLWTPWSLYTNVTFKALSVINSLSPHQMQALY
jgi:hypothetical protein